MGLTGGKLSISGSLCCRRDEVGSVLREAASIQAEIPLLLDLEGPLEGLIESQGKE